MSTTYNTKSNDSISHKQVGGQCVSYPSSEKLRRLVADCAGYLGQEPGEQVPRDEVRKQARANGYSRDEFEAFAPDADSFVAPERDGSIFGSFGCDEVPQSSAQSDKLIRFREWCQSKQRKQDFDHSYTLKKARKRYARAKDVDRHFSENYDTFSTVFITYCKGVRDSSESIAENAKSLYTRRLVRKRRRILKELGVYDDYAGVSLLAPKPGDEVPHPSTQSGEPYTHAHDFLWIPGTDVSEEDFLPLVESFAEDVDDFDVDRAISVEHHNSGEIDSPSVCEMDRQRGPTTALPQELGRNLPLLDLSYEQGRYDARDAPGYVEKWCAALRLGKDGDLSTKGVRRFRPLGGFHDFAEVARTRRRLQEARASADALVEVADEPYDVIPHPSAPTDQLTENEMNFVEEYLSAGGSKDKEIILETIRDNMKKLAEGTGVLHTDAIVAAIQGEG